jgi:hypothetical protein
MNGKAIVAKQTTKHLLKILSNKFKKLFNRVIMYFSLRSQPNQKLYELLSSLKDQLEP